MTVKELRESLEKCPDDTLVVFDTIDHAIWGIVEVQGSTVFSRKNYALSYSRVPWAEYVDPIDVVILIP